MVYEWDSETHAIDDAVICKFEGIEVGGDGKARKWEGYFENERSNELYLFCVEQIDAPAFAEFWRERDPEESGAFVEERGFEIITWECDEPIVSTFQ